MRTKIELLLACVCGAFLAACAGAKYEANWASLDRRPVADWWKDAKFGIFVHWGPYCVPAYAPFDSNSFNMCYCYSEHYQHRILQKIPEFLEFNRKFNDNRAYVDFVSDFRAEHFDAAQWADLFKRAGAKYAVLTSKHHDGFALWPTKAGGHFNAMDAGPHRDICRAFMDGMHAAGLHAGFYYSLIEYGNPYYTNESTRPAFIENVNLVQLKELADDYGADIIWPDGEWFDTPADLRSEEYLAWLFNESKVRDTVVVNDRWGLLRKGDKKTVRGIHGGHYTTEYGFEFGEIGDGEKGKASEVHPWEECRGIGLSFGYNRFERAENYMTSAACIELLVRVVAGGGNLLLNVGPDRHGFMPPIMEERLLDMGKWLKVNGEAIYGTTAGGRPAAKKPADGVYCTRKGATRYAIMVGWHDAPFVVKGVTSASSVTMLGTDAKVAWRTTAGGLEITPPVLTLSHLPCEHAWAFKITP